MTVAPTPVVLSVLSVSKVFGIQPILENASFTVHEGDRIGLIGRNGTGKSTLTNLIADMHTPDRGTIIRRQNHRTALDKQDCPAALHAPGASVSDNVNGECESAIRASD